MRPPPRVDPPILPHPRIHVRFSWLDHTRPPRAHRLFADRLLNKRSWVEMRQGYRFEAGPREESVVRVQRHQVNNRFAFNVDNIFMARLAGHVTHARCGKERTSDVWPETRDAERLASSPWSNLVTAYAYWYVDNSKVCRPMLFVSGQYRIAITPLLGYFSPPPSLKE